MSTAGMVHEYQKNKGREQYLFRISSDKSTSLGSSADEDIAS
jgi:hypothetical protein